MFTCSAYDNNNIDKVFRVITEFDEKVKENGHFYLTRKTQDKKWLKETLKELILNDFFASKEHTDALKEMENEVVEGKLTSFQAAEKLFKKFKDGGGV